jgi:multisubunit Na+/H+ antiporter MnhF subunit
MAWSVAVFALLVLLAGSFCAIARGDALDRAVGLQLANVLGVLAVVALAVATGRGILIDIALVLAVLGLASGLAYARFLERWL